MGKKKGKNPAAPAAATQAAAPAPAATASTSASPKNPPKPAAAAAKVPEPKPAAAAHPHPTPAPAAAAAAPAGSGKKGKKSKGKKGKKGSKEEEEDDEEEVEVTSFEELQVSQEEIIKGIKDRSRIAYFSMDILDCHSDDVIVVHLFGTAAKVAPNGKVEVPVSPLDSTLFVMMRLETMIRVSMDFWNLVVKTPPKGGKPGLLFLDGSEMIYRLGFHKKNSKNTVFLLSSLEKDVDDFKVTMEQPEKVKDDSRPPLPHFFTLEEKNLPADLKTWEQKSRHSFRLQNPELTPEEEEGEDEDAVEAYVDKNVEEEVSEGPKILEIDDDTNLEEMDANDRRQKEGKRQKIVDQVWQSYHSLRVKQHKTHDYDRLDEIESLGGSGTGVIDTMLKNVDHILSETKFTKEQKDILRHNFAVLRREVVLEDSEIVNLDVATRVYSLVKNAAVDVVGTFGHHPEKIPVDFHAALAFKLSSPVEDEEVLALYDEYPHDKIPSSSGWSPIFSNALDVDKRARRVYKEKRKMALTRKNILDIRKTLFGASKSLNSCLSDYQLMKLILCSVGANFDVPHGTPTYLAIDDYFGYHLRLTCKASTPEDDQFVEHNFEDDIRELMTDDEEHMHMFDDDDDYDDDDDDEYFPYDDYDDYGDDDDAHFHGDPRMACPQS